MNQDHQNELAAHQKRMQNFVSDVDRAIGGDGSRGPEVVLEKAATLRLINNERAEQLATTGRGGMSGGELAIARELVTLERRRVAAIELEAQAAAMDANTRALALVGVAGVAAIVIALVWRASKE